MVRLICPTHSLKIIEFSYESCFLVKVDCFLYFDETDAVICFRKSNWAFMLGFNKILKFVDPKIKTIERINLSFTQYYVLYVRVSEHYLPKKSR